MAKRQFYVAQGNKVLGPVEVEQLKAMARDGRLSREDGISTDRKKWRRAHRVGGLFPDEATESAPQPEPAPEIKIETEPSKSSAPPPRPQSRAPSPARPSPTARLRRRLRRGPQVRARAP